MTSIFKHSVILAALLLVGSSTKAEALFCGSDGWGTVVADIIGGATGSALIGTDATLSHVGSHPTCFGTLDARVMLSVGGPVCASEFEHEPHLPGDGNTNIQAIQTCSIFCGTNARARGQVYWNEDQEERTPESGNLRQPCDCNPPPQGCPIEGCVWSYYECACVDCCPLVFDTSGRGYKLTSADLGVWFDINADGQPDAISWTDPSRDVAFLAFDRNGNHLIDHGEELFGNVTPKPTAIPSVAKHGFDALASLELPDYGASTRDGVIDARDAAYHRLLLWTDTNHDGVSQKSELQTASAAGLVAIESRYRESKRVDEFGNEYRLRGISWWRRSGSLDPRFFYDVWFVPQTMSQPASRLLK